MAKKGVITKREFQWQCDKALDGFDFIEPLLHYLHRRYGLPQVTA
jgi:hypothetical protein